MITKSKHDQENIEKYFGMCYTALPGKRQG